MKVLIADDDAAQRRLLQYYMRKWGYRAIEVPDGERALDALNDPEIVLALLDWDMPLRSGLDVCRTLPALGRYVHAIVLTAHTGLGNLGDALAAGASDFLAKPVAPAELQARLQVGFRIVTLLDRVSHHRKMESIGSLAAGMAHEINTPAQALMANLQFLEGTLGDLLPPLRQFLAEPQSLSGEAALQVLGSLREQCTSVDFPFLEAELPTALRESQRNVDRIVRIVQMILEFSIPRDAPLRPGDLNEVARSAVSLMRHACEGIAELRLELAPDLPQVECASGAILEALCALITNASEAIARKARPDGSARGESEKGSEDEIVVMSGHDGVHVELHVRDTGGGIAPEIQHRIYDPFFTTKGVGEGMGQGLARVHWIVVVRHGGLLSFRTEEGGGTTFCVRLPVSAASLAAEGIRSA
jgi:signal transduction histidine kinase